MPDLRRRGLIEALSDFGIDMNWQGLDLSLDSFPTIVLQDLSLNYEPALRCRAVATVELGAGGAGLFSLAVIQAFSDGFWVTGLGHLSASGGTAIWVANAPPAGFVAGAGISFNLIGSAAGEAADQQAPEFFRLSATGFWPAALVPSHLQLDARRANYDKAFWVPPNACLVLSPTINNLNLLAQVELRITSASNGRFA